jgi:hypothetical protein
MITHLSAPYRIEPRGQINELNFLINNKIPDLVADDDCWVQYQFQIDKSVRRSENRSPGLFELEQRQYYHKICFFTLY